MFGLDLLWSSVGYVATGLVGLAIPHPAPPAATPATYQSEPALAAQFCNERGILPENCELFVDGSKLSFSTWAYHQKR